MINTLITSQAAAWGAIIVGLIGLTLSADRFVHYAASIAKCARMSDLMIGMTIVALGTSAPEIMVSIIAALTGNPKLAIGNALGSNIANTGLVLGSTLLIAPITIKRHILFKEYPLLMGVTLLTGWVLMDLKLDGLDAGLLFLGLLSLAAYVVYQHFKMPRKPEITADTEAPLQAPLQPKSQPRSSFGVLLLGFSVSLALLLLCSRLLVWGSVQAASALGISDTLIGLTIVAIGTSLPELAVSLTSAVKKHHGLALGNIIGSNVFNLLIVLPWPGLIAPTALEPEVFLRDYALLCILTFGLASRLYFFKTPFMNPGSTNPAATHTHRSIGWKTGALLTGAYIGYIIYLIQLYLVQAQ